MDDIVKQAMAKWPNVPYCYGWLALDARGNWRMRDERAQHLNLPGDKLTHPALLGFIARNYGHDERGCWFFQNGPQRVYLHLEATPYIVRTDPAQGWLLQTGVAPGAWEEAFMTETGELILRSGDIVAQLDDRDFALVLPMLVMDGKAVEDEALLAWLEGGPGQLSLINHAGHEPVAVQRIARADVASHFDFVREPSTDTASVK